ncbi:MAG: RIP metalloprotease RseP [Candidatus Omnitrophica bacterium]|nr:RIP metalloprotease RseP [Candidatus Omnitrophota bacterium]
MVAIIIVIFIFSVIILMHEAGHLLAAKKVGIDVEVFSLGMGKRLFGIKRGGTDYRVSLFPFGGYIKMAGEDPQEAKGLANEFFSKPVGHRFWVIFAGAFTNYIFAFILFSVIFMVGVPTLSNEVGQVLNGYPAEKAGILTGDKIISINGKEIKYWEDIVGNIKADYKNEKPLIFGIIRKDEPREIPVVPKVSTVKNIFGQTISQPLIGVAPASKIIAVSYNPFQSVYYAGKKLLELTFLTYKGIWLLITGGLPVKDSVSGPIGIAYLMKQAAALGIIPLLVITAHVSMALGIFNLLPFPVLDGGHIIFLGIEKLRRKPLSIKVQEIITQIAVAILIAFAVFVSWQDVLKFTPIGKKAVNSTVLKEKVEVPVGK